MATFKTVELFGGAMIAELPSTLADVSEIRQVPDNQEVYLDRDGFSSIVFDILERVEGQSSDAEALKYHLSDIVAEDAGQTKIYALNEARFAKLPAGTPALTLLAISPPGEKQRGRANEPDFVGIWLVLIRLEEQRTDLVITVNVPHLPGHYDRAAVDPESCKYGALLDAGRDVRDKLLESFDIKDWNLFVQE